MKTSLFNELKQRAVSWLSYRGVTVEAHDDIIQAAFIRVLRGWKRKGEDDEFARRVWKNAVSQSLVDFQRKRHGWLELSETLTDGSWARKETEELAQAACEAMTVKQYMALIALRENDFDQKATARELGMAESSLSELLGRMRVRVRRELKLGESVPSEARVHNVYREKKFNFNVDYPTVALWFVEDNRAQFERDGWSDPDEEERVHPMTRSIV